MRFLNYIGEFFLFRWLFGKLPQAADRDTPIRKSSEFLGYLSKSDGLCHSESYDDFHEEQDDYDMMDDF